MALSLVSDMQLHVKHFHLNQIYYLQNDFIPTSRPVNDIRTCISRIFGSKGLITLSGPHYEQVVRAIDCPCLPVQNGPGMSQLCVSCAAKWTDLDVRLSR